MARRPPRPNRHITPEGAFITFNTYKPMRIVNTVRRRPSSNRPTSRATPYWKPDYGKLRKDRK